MVEMDLFSISVRSGKNPRPAVVPPSPVRYACVVIIIIVLVIVIVILVVVMQTMMTMMMARRRRRMTTVMMTLVHVHVAKLALPSNSLKVTPKLHIARHLKAKYKNTHCSAIKGRNTNVKKLQYKISTTFK